ncbi:MAG: hypothetical protein Kow00127_24860 [Bacteroidales bacterium]
MKRFVIFLVSLSFLAGLLSCNRARVKDLEARYDSLMMVNLNREKSLQESLSTFVSIQETLDSIKQKELMISEQADSDDELRNKTVRQQINSDILQLYEMLLDAREKLADARKSLGKRSYQLTEMEKILDGLRRQLEERTAEVSDLYARLEALNIQVAGMKQKLESLQEENRMKSSVIISQQKELEESEKARYRGWFVAGTKKQLKEAGIINAEGGIIGLGKSFRINPDADLSLFEEIDIREQTRFELPEGKVQIITDHPEEAYRLTEQEGLWVLEVTDVESFWRSAKFLVVMVR